MEKDFLNTKQAADYLGVSIKTIYSYTNKRTIPFYKVNNRKVLFKKKDLDEFLFSPSNRSSSIYELKLQVSDYIENSKIKDIYDRRKRYIAAEVKMVSGE